MHAHHIPDNFLKWAKANPEIAMASVQTSFEGPPMMVHEQGYVYPLPAEFTNIDACRSKHAEAGIDYTLLSPAPPLFYYWAEPETAVAVAKLINEGMAEAVDRRQDHFGALGTLPMSVPDRAAAELERGLRDNKLKGFLIGTDVEGKPLDHPDFAEFWQAADEHGALLVLHPYYVGNRAGLEDYYLTNLIGNPLNTGLAAARLILSGLLDRHENIRLVLVHGGGYLPYQIGRLDHGYRVRRETAAVAARPPSAYLRRFYYDTVTFHGTSLQFLIDLVGSDRVVLGTDFPFDMADWPPSPVHGETFQAFRNVLGGNAAQLLGLDVERGG